MSKITTLEIGGPAKEFVIVKTEEDLTEVIKNARKAGKDFLVVGGGSNLLVSDSGVDKLVIKNEVEGIEKSEDIVRVKSGTPLQTLIDFTIEQGLSGLQKLTGIPGTVGGAVFGAAGAYGQEIIDNLVKVRTFDGEKVTILSKDECGFNYRDSGFKRNRLIILEVIFQLSPGNPKRLKEEADEILSQRLKKYPKGIKCPGSFFKNIIADTLPEEILSKIQGKIVYGKLPAGTLLEEVGAKGDHLDDIEIASYHANLFVNKGGGTAKDFYDLAKKYWEKVYQKFGIELEPEVQLVNLPNLR